MKTKQILGNGLYNALQEDNKVLAVILFGSLARNEPHRDVDICLVLDKKYDNLVMSKMRLNYTAFAKKNIDMHVFQQLPLYVQQRVLNEGKIILCKDEDVLYETAFATIKEMNFYKKVYENYLVAVEA